MLLCYIISMVCVVSVSKKIYSHKQYHVHLFDGCVYELDCQFGYIKA